MFFLLYLACGTPDKMMDTAADTASTAEDTAETETIVAERPERMQGFFLDTERYPKALCNDGSKPIMYYRPGVGEGTNKWVIWFEGGEACMDQESCLERWQNKRNLMTTCAGEDCSDYEAPTELNKGGILSSVEEENPHFYTWNHVMMNYCSSDFWTGNRNESITFGTIEVLFRGHYIAESMVSTLLADPLMQGYASLSQATDIVMSGSSAGGIGMRNHIDYFRDRLSTANVVGFSDASVVPLISQEVMQVHSARAQQQMQAWEAFVDVSCQANHPDQHHLCLKGAYLVLHNEIQTPMFFHQDQSDSYGYSANSVLLEEEPSEAFKESVHEAVRDFFTTHTDAAYIPRQGYHVIATTDRFNDPNMLDGVSVSDALWGWYQGARTLYIEP